MTVGLLPGVETLLQRLATFQYSLFRLETMQSYSGSSEDIAFAAYQAGQPIPVTAELREWCDRVQQRTSDGATIQRVHAVIEPLSDYMRFELASYAPNVDTGEDVRILPVPPGGEWPTDVLAADFWLIDSHEMWDMRYADDGAWLGAAPVDDPVRVVAACHSRDAALAQSRRWSDYMAMAHGRG